MLADEMKQVMKVLAEGIESEEHQQFLKTLSG